jgi:hypothetical protein
MRWRRSRILRCDLYVKATCWPCIDLLNSVEGGKSFLGVRKEKYRKYAYKERWEGSS